MRHNVHMLDTQPQGIGELLTAAVLDELDRHGAEEHLPLVRWKFGDLDDRSITGVVLDDRNWTVSSAWAASLGLEPAGLEPAGLEPGESDDPHRIRRWRLLDGPWTISLTGIADGTEDDE
ncbi:hypothetical protein BH09ACT1_BH09ACT1_24620 [soil metagenome]